MLAFKSLLALALAAVAIQAAVIERTTSSVCDELYPTDFSSLKEVHPNFTRTKLKSDNKVTLERFTSTDDTVVSRKVRYQSSGKPQYIEIDTEENKRDLLKIVFLTKHNSKRAHYFNLTSETKCNFIPPKGNYQKIIDASYYTVIE